MRLDEVNWADQLPYDRGNEDSEFGREFVAQFRLSVLGGDLPAVSAMLAQLDSSYLVLSPPLRIHICRIMYEFVTTQTLDLTLFGLCCATLARMLRRESKLTTSDLSFDWRKLYGLVRTLVFPKVWQDNPIQQRSKLKNAVDLACAINRFFPAAAAGDVFRELLPQLQFNSLDWQIAGVQLLNLFVPTAPPERGGEAGGPAHWLPTIFSLWSFNLRASGYDAYFMRLVTCLVVEQSGRLQLKNEQIRFAFASGLHFFNLPAGSGMAALPRGLSSSLTDSSAFYRMPNGGALPLAEERALTFARFVVYTLHDESPGGTLDLFGQLVQMVEPFYHPSNNGPWSGILARFLRHLAKILLLRSRAEAADDCTVPAAARLRRPIRRRFVVLVRTLAMLLLFSKGEDLVGMSHSTLKHLAEVEPDLVFRPLLDTLYTAIDSVTETHRMISAMRALEKLAATLSNFAHYPEGAQHVAPLLTLTLPGIDVNDPVKSCFALSFVSNLCHNGVVFEELAAPGDMPGPRPPSRSPSAAAGDDQDAVDEPPEVDMEQVEWMTRASTAQFEAWIDQYLRRVFALVDNLSSSLDTAGGPAAEAGLDTIAAHTTKMVLHQCSERYYPMITRLIAGFATSITSLSAVGSVRKLVGAFASAIPEHALPALLPLCCERIADEIENGVGLTPSLSRVTQSHSETTLIWFVSVLVALTENQDGRQLLRYRAQLLRTVDLLFSQCLSRQVYTAAGSLLYNTLSCLTRTAPHHGRSVPDSLWADPAFHENHFRYWGQHPDVGDPAFKVTWHVPSAEEVAFALEIVRQVVQPRIGELGRFIDALADSRHHQPTNRENVSLNRLLVMLDHGVRGLGCLIPPPSAPIAPEALAEALVEGDDANGMPSRYRLGQQVAAGYVFTDPACSEFQELAAIRDAAAQAAAKALAHMASNREDNVENIKCVVLLAQNVICHHGVDRDMFSGYRRVWSFALEAFTLDANTSVMPRLIAVRRALFTQVSRTLHNTRFMPATDVVRGITSHMAGLCLSAYAEVRNYAIAALDNIVSVLPAVKYPLIPRFLGELDDRAESDPDKMTGALRVLDTLAMRRACLRDWRYFSAMVLALCRAQHEDKPVVKRLVSSTAVSQVVYVTAPLPAQEIQPAVRELALALADDDIEAAVAEGRERRRLAYEFARAENSRLVNALVDIQRDAGTTWRFAAIAGYYLDQLSTIWAPLEPRLVGALAQNLTSDLVLFRESATVNLTQLLGKIRRRSKAASPPAAAAGRRIALDVAGSAAGRALRQPAYAELCERALAGEEAALAAPYVDSPTCGWFAWPQTAKAYAAPPGGDAPAFDRIDGESQPALEAVRSVLFADGKWAQIARLFSMEGARSPDEDHFGVQRAALFAQLFSLFGAPLLERAWPAVEQLAREHQRAGAQRAAAEMIAGLLRGSKHWARASLAAMWERLVPVMEAVLSRLTPDILRFWQVCLHFAFARRDPRRFLPLIRLVVYSDPFNPRSEAPFAEAAKLELLRVLVSAWDWRIASTIAASRPRLLDALAHPYKQVRDAAGVVMYMLSLAEFSVSYADVDGAVDDLARYGPTGRDFSSWPGTQRAQALVRDMVARVGAWKEDHVPSNEGTSSYSRGSKTLLTFFVSGFRYSPRWLAVAHIPAVLPLASVLQEQHDDDEVARLAKIIMQYFSQVLYTGAVAEDVAARMLALLRDSAGMWHVVTRTLPLLCTLTFANRFTLSREIRARIVDAAAQLLEHEQIEVRHAASAALTTLVKCASARVIAELNARFSARLDAPLPRVRRGRAPVDPAVYARSVLTRHAGVLGLSCLVLASPYTVPDWLPEVLVRLAGCIDDPNPIQSTVQRTFAEFRRTHMDTWHEDRKRFSSSQLEILTDMLVSPCYYA
ncbi:Proteasome activator BLM10 [Coemansia javaensis]|uniref:Proteasome activator BLM10 n=1 Tax=Coemansia javaensis TaxID=2761396 RepID=A0A9W8LLL2_9FUNG|nr:Proteasome activator BLM10 [Coemansia javaensis]